MSVVFPDPEPPAMPSMTGGGASKRGQSMEEEEEEEEEVVYEGGEGVCV